MRSDMNLKTGGLVQPLGQARQKSLRDVLHDENRSGDMDKGLGGIPLEGYGVTETSPFACSVAVTM